MMHDETSGLTNNRGNVFSQAWKHFQQRYQKLLDDFTPFVIGRWIFAAILTVAFVARVLLLQGWYIVTYALGIYHLNLFIAFLSPKIDPAIIDYEDDGGPELPTRAGEEFRPFIRRLPEFKFWYSVTKSVVIAIICTCFDCFNIPVFWPILVMYFITLFGITMKRQIKHMIKYRYLPFTHSKPKYQGVQDSGKNAVAPSPLLYGYVRIPNNRLPASRVLSPVLDPNENELIIASTSGQSEEDLTIFEKT